MPISIELESDEAVFFWTYNDRQHLTKDERFTKDSVLARDSIEQYAYDEASVRFDSPASFLDGAEPYTIDMQREMDGLYRYSNEEDEYYEAVRSDTATHIILMGTWRGETEDSHICTGSFVAVFPKKDVTS